jgi:hypothetical protein
VPAWNLAREKADSPWNLAPRKEALPWKVAPENDTSSLKVALENTLENNTSEKIVSPWEFSFKE